jgi:hypothetical protein
MMSENHKDNLYKLSQKYGFNNPEYVTVKSGPDHNPDYISVVNINDVSFKGEICRTKKIAESKAALEALNYINVTYLNNIRNTTKITKMCLFLNFDNLEMLNNEITSKELLNRNLDIYLFANKNDYLVYENLLNDKCSVEGAFPLLPNEIIKIISPSTHSSNLCMMTYTGSLLIKNIYDIYFIAMPNKFSPVLIDMIKDKNLGWHDKEAYQITKIEQIYEILSL